MKPRSKGHCSSGQTVAAHFTKLPEVERILARREIRRQLARIQAAGSPVGYRTVDVRDGAAVRAVMAEIRSEFGVVRGLIHGAGVLADRKIVDQTDAQFDACSARRRRRHVCLRADPGCRDGFGCSSFPERKPIRSTGSKAHSLGSERTGRTGLQRCDLSQRRHGARRCPGVQRRTSRRSFAGPSGCPALGLGVDPAAKLVGKNASDDTQEGFSVAFRPTATRR